MAFQPLLLATPPAARSEREHDVVRKPLTLFGIMLVPAGLAWFPDSRCTKWQRAGVSPGSLMSSGLDQDQLPWRKSMAKADAAFQLIDFDLAVNTAFWWRTV
ncbi:hypothetical protein GFL91_23530 [Rhizobium leguminosarum bv. viciae]|uniref:Uncharacterized protein n=1 Tax=Rhizobium leguminosarum bv. viciae TaxID=387 RepID=A0A8I2GSZ9_RHILV|nr:hypothetical protein [Rhizobium leguminosarum bv. viciae]NKM47884.1 hypothetical protein [Rhizobium leguminosarum bv. viciae]NKM98936.1 hypothetical protein [Rhizobium leguminosarum bv. viciae]TCA04183.1 hypothetical protein E0H57_17960 [Rhizobium leguminosarum bv. viciae]